VPEAAVCSPDAIRVQRAPGDSWAEPSRAGIDVRASSVGLGLKIDVAAPAGVARVLLRWRRRFAGEDVLVLGDAWERSYGDLEWRGARAERPLPWTVLVHHRASGATEGLGVEVRPAAFAFWTIDADGVTLVLDLRSGGAAVVPGDRAIHAATIRSLTGEATPFATQRALARLQCAAPGLASAPIVGANNWYYAYGRGFDAAAVLRDAQMVAELAGDHPVRPFGVIDDGWTPDGTADGRPGSGGPWDAGRADAFPDMPAVAAAIRAAGVRPGIWFRPLLRRDAFPAGIRGQRSGAIALDPSSPAVLDLVAEDVRRLTGWGFELLKHDFSTYDLLGRWGPAMGASPAADGWALADPGVTTAEALVAFYTCLREAAGDALVLGCNVVGHLAAGLVHAQRTGDDTSGIEWDQTRRAGVNTLAFRLAQHGAFFAADPDCVPSTPRTDWAMNRQFLDLVARSGAVLFVSVDPATRSAAVDADLAAALRLALDGGVPGGVEPLDWLSTPTPRRWRSGSEEIMYSWLQPLGADPFEPVTSY
jgi:alpha-galactosidase